MKTILLRLKGFQSWGDSSREVYRETVDFPTFSGVLGLIRSAMNVRNDNPITQELSALKMAVRVIHAGKKEQDYHVASNFINMAGKAKQNVQTWRRYLVDADFLVALTGKNDIINSIAQAIQSPKYHLFLGRMACSPTLPIFAGIVEASNSLEALKQANCPDLTTGLVQFIIESDKVDKTSQRIQDLPTETGYSTRTVKSIWATIGEPDVPV